MFQSTRYLSTHGIRIISYAFGIPCLSLVFLLIWAGAGDSLAGEETCDAIDNDNDGTIDEGCDLICDNPEKWGSDARLTYNDKGSYFASLAWTGTGYGLVWCDWIYGGDEIYFVKLDPLGNMIAPMTRLTYDTAWSENPDLIWTGSEFALVWWDERGGFDEIYFQRLDSSGNMIGDNVRVTYNEPASEMPSLVWTGSEYGIAWTDFRDLNAEIYFARLDSSGNKIKSDVRISEAGGYSGYPSLAWNGNEYLVSWHDDRDGNFEIYSARLDYRGRKIGSDVRITYDPADSQYPSLIWTGSEYALAWQDFRDGNWEIYYARFDSFGNKIGSDTRVSYGIYSSFNPDIAWTGSEYGITWDDYRDNSVRPEIYIGRIDSSGNKIGNDVRITYQDSFSEHPSHAWTGTGYGVAWEDYRDSWNYEIYFARIGCCDDDDMDTYTELPCSGGDCDDNDASVYPSAPEICDYKDNDCDGTIDEGFVTPGTTIGLAFDKNKSTMNWNAVTPADRYDVAKGDLMALQSSKGDFTSSLIGCCENDSLDTQTSDSNNPDLGQGFYYLVRAQNCQSKGTYNTEQSSQIGDRDAEIEASSNKCP